jgi:cell division protein FtsW (lipid II flippase)
VIASTLLTLIVVPVFYAMIDGATAWIKRRFGLTPRYPQ